MTTQRERLLQRRMYRRTACLGLLLLVQGATARESAAASSRGKCPLANLELVKGMPRLEVERKVALALGKRLEYSPIGNSLSGGEVRYRAAACTLVVTYQPGAPAPLVSTPDGQTQHLAPRDEIVLSFQLQVPRRPKGP